MKRQRYMAGMKVKNEDILPFMDFAEDNGGEITNVSRGTEVGYRVILVKCKTWEERTSIIECGVGKCISRYTLSL